MGVYCAPCIQHSAPLLLIPEIPHIDFPKRMAAKIKNTYIGFKQWQRISAIRIFFLTSECILFLNSDSELRQYAYSSLTSDAYTWIETTWGSVPTSFVSVTKWIAFVDSFPKKWQRISVLRVCKLHILLATLRITNSILLIPEIPKEIFRKVWQRKSEIRILILTSDSEYR